MQIAKCKLQIKSEGRGFGRRGRLGADDQFSICILQFAFCNCPFTGPGLP
jgi:hypothetical protein